MVPTDNKVSINDNMIPTNDKKFVSDDKMVPTYKPLYFYLENGISIDRLDIIKLAGLIVNSLPLDKLYPLDENLIFFDNCCDFMDEYINKNPNDDLSQCYVLLKQDILGKNLLIQNIKRRIFERMFREGYTSIDIIKQFQLFQVDYETFLINNSYAFGTINNSYSIGTTNQKK